jgi:hypothetical protein
MFTIKSEVVGRPPVASESLVENIGEKIMKDGASRFQNITGTR